MECGTAQEILLDAERDGAPAGERDHAAAQNHVATCSGCRAALADLRRYRTVLRRREGPAEPAGGWDAFADRLVDSVGKRFEETADQSAGVARRWAGNAAHLNYRMDDPAGHGRGVRASWGIVAAAAAACLLAGGFGFWLGRQRAGSGVARDTAAIATPAALTDEDTRYVARAFAELHDDRSGGSRTSWAVLNGDATDSGFEPVDSAERRPEGNALWVLRVTALRAGHVVSLIDLAILPGRVADVKVAIPASGGQVLHYLISTSPGPSPRATVWTDLEIKGEGVVSTAGGEVELRHGDPAFAGRLGAPGGGLEVRVGFAETAFDVQNSSTRPLVRGKGTL